MEFGFGELRLSPDAFWNMTLRELFTAYDWYKRSHAKPGALTAEGLDDLSDWLSKQPSQTKTLRKPRAAQARHGSIKGQPGAIQRGGS